MQVILRGSGAGLGRGRGRGRGRSHSCLVTGLEAVVELFGECSSDGLVVKGSDIELLLLLRAGWLVLFRYEVLTTAVLLVLSQHGCFLFYGTDGKSDFEVVAGGGILKDFAGVNDSFEIMLFYKEMVVLEFGICLQVTEMGNIIFMLEISRGCGQIILEGPI